MRQSQERKRRGRFICGDAMECTFHARGEVAVLDCLLLRRVASRQAAVAADAGALMCCHRRPRPRDILSARMASPRGCRQAWRQKRSSAAAATSPPSSAKDAACYMRRFPSAADAFSLPMSPDAFFAALSSPSSPVPPLLAIFRDGAAASPCLPSESAACLLLSRMSARCSA